jgi:hypothetical protein
LLTTFSVHLVSTKKITAADLIVGVTATAAAGAGSLLVTKSVDPNQSHPYREVDIIGRAGGPAGLGVMIGSQKVGQYQFRALVHAYDAKAKPEYYWRDETGAVTRYSPVWVAFIRRLSEADLKEAVRTFKAR